MEATDRHEIDEIETVPQRHSATHGEELRCDYIQHAGEFQLFLFQQTHFARHYLYYVVAS